MSADKQHFDPSFDLGKVTARRDVVIIMLGVATFFIIGGLSWYQFRSDERRRDRMTAEAPASVHEVFVSKDIDPETGQTSRVVNVRVRYSYTVGDMVFDRVSTMNSTRGKLFQAGGVAKVCYNPDNHEEAEIFPAGHSCPGSY